MMIFVSFAELFLPAPALASNPASHFAGESATSVLNSSEPLPDLQAELQTEPQIEPQTEPDFATLLAASFASVATPVAPEPVTIAAAPVVKSEPGHTAALTTAIDVARLAPELQPVGLSGTAALSSFVRQKALAVADDGSSAPPLRDNAATFRQPLSLVTQPTDSPMPLANAGAEALDIGPSSLPVETPKKGTVLSSLATSTRPNPMPNVAFASGISAPALPDDFAAAPAAELPRPSTAFAIAPTNEPPPIVFADAPTNPPLPVAFADLPTTAPLVLSTAAPVSQPPVLLRTVEVVTGMTAPLPVVLRVESKTVVARESPRIELHTAADPTAPALPAPPVVTPITQHRRQPAPEFRFLFPELLVASERPPAVATQTVVNLPDVIGDVRGDVGVNEVRQAARLSTPGTNKIAGQASRLSYIFGSGNVEHSTVVEPEAAPLAPAVFAREAIEATEKPATNPTVEEAGSTAPALSWPGSVAHQPSGPAPQAPSLINQTVSPVIALAQQTPPRETRSLRLSLQPQELGRVEVEVTRDATGRLSASLHAEQLDAATTLTQGLSHLRASLAQAGLVVERLEVVATPSFQAHTGGQTSQQQPSHTPPQTRPPELQSLPETAEAERATTEKLLNLRA